jgi:hypothetical protein
LLDAARTLKSDPGPPDDIVRISKSCRGKVLNRESARQPLGALVARGGSL